MGGRRSIGQEQAALLRQQEIARAHKRAVEMARAREQAELVQRAPIIAMEREMAALEQGDEPFQAMEQDTRRMIQEREGQQPVLARQAVLDRCLKQGLPRDMAERAIGEMEPQQRQDRIRRKDMTAEQRAERRRQNAERRLAAERERAQAAQDDSERRVAEMRLAREQERLKRLERKQEREQGLDRPMAVLNERQVRCNEILVAESMRPIPWEQDRPIDTTVFQQDDLWRLGIEPFNREQDLPEVASIRDLREHGYLRPLKPERLLAMDRDLDEEMALPLAPILCLEEEARTLGSLCGIYERNREGRRPEATGPSVDTAIAARASDYLPHALPALLQPMDRDQAGDKAIIAMSRDIQIALDRPMDDRARLLEIARLLEEPADAWRDKIHGNSRTIGSAIASLPDGQRWDDATAATVSRHMMLAMGVDPDRHRSMTWIHDNGQHLHVLFSKIRDDGQMWLGEHSKLAMTAGRSRWDHHAQGDVLKMNAPIDKELHESWKLLENGQLFAKYKDLRTGQISALPLQDHAWMERLGREAKPAGDAGVWAIKRSYGGRDQTMLHLQIRHLSGCAGA